MLRMSIFNFKNRPGTASKLKQELNTLRSDFRSFRFHIQGYIDALTGEESPSVYGTNNYKEYEKAVQAVNLKYENGAVWGNALTANIVDFRAAVTVSSGPQYKPAMDSTIQQKDEEGKSIGTGNEGSTPVMDEAEAEIDFCRSFFEANDINHETPQEWGREGEIEGRVAVRLKWDETKKQVIAEHLPWIKYKYKEIRSKQNPKIVESIEWDAQVGSNIPAGTVGGDELVCRRFSGRLSSKNPTTKIMRCLTQIDYIDQGFRDWREINRLYASPVPDVECKTPEEAEEMNAAIKGSINWKIKKLFVHSGVFSYKGPEMTGIDSLEKEITRQACFVAGTTGYPLQFLLPDMLANRSTSENIMESALIHTASERAIWTGFYEELISKAMKMYSEKTSKSALDPNKISITISLMTEEQWQRLIQFWLPAFREELVSREAALSQIPDFNIREELDRREKADNSRIAQITSELDKVKKEAESGNPPDNGNGNTGGNDDIE